MRGRMTKGELIERCLAQGQGRFLVLDAVCVGPAYHSGDVYHCGIDTAWRWELGGGEHVSVRIAEGTPRGDAVSILRRMAGLLEQEGLRPDEAAPEAGPKAVPADASGRLSPREREQLCELLRMALGQDAEGILWPSDVPF